MKSVMVDWRVYCEDMKLDELTSFMPLLREMTRTWLSEHDEHDEHHWGPLLGVERHAFRAHGIHSIRQSAPILKTSLSISVHEK